MLLFLTRIKNGLMMTGMSIGFMFSHPKLFFFPILRIVLFSITYPFLFTLFFFAMWKSADWLPESLEKPYGLVVLVLFLFLLFYLFFFIVLFASIAAIDYLYALLNNQQPSILTSLSVALRRIPSILLWAGMHTIVAFILALVRGDEKKSSVWRIFLGEALAVAWGVATFFVPAILAEEDKSLKETIKESAQLMKDTFGEVAGFAAGFSLIAGLIFPGIIIAIASLLNYLHDSGKKFALDFYEYPYASYIFLTIFLITIIIRVFITTAQDVFKAAAFNYAHKKPTGPFSERLIRESIINK